MYHKFPLFHFGEIDCFFPRIAIFCNVISWVLTSFRSAIFRLDFRGEKRRGKAKERRGKRNLFLIWTISLFFSHHFGLTRVLKKQNNKVGPKDKKTGQDADKQKKVEEQGQTKQTEKRTIGQSKQTDKKQSKQTKGPLTIWHKRL